MKEYEWDNEKRQLNLKKHGIDFVGAIKIFEDPGRIEFSSHRKGEERFQTIGVVHEVVIISLVYTVRKGKKRIISARKASKNERETYYEKNA